MEGALALLVGLIFAAAVYLILSRALIRVLLGIVLLGNGVNLLIFVAGRVTTAVPPIVPKGAAAPAGVFANPLPQALILTAIVIGFGLLVFALALAYRSYYVLGTAEMDEMRVSEPDRTRPWRIDTDAPLIPSHGGRGRRPGHARCAGRPRDVHAPMGLPGRRLPHA